MAEASWHTFQVLTKRAERLEAVAGGLPWPPNVWMGVSVEQEDYAFRIDHLRRTPAAVKFLSLEPLLGPLRGLDLRGIDWVIVGGESGPRRAADGRRLGRWTSGISVDGPGCRSSSSSGADATRKRRGGCSPGGRGTSFRPASDTPVNRLSLESERLQRVEDGVERSRSAPGRAACVVYSVVTSSSRSPSGPRSVNCSGTMPMAWVEQLRQGS